VDKRQVERRDGVRARYRQFDPSILDKAAANAAGLRFEVCAPQTGLDAGCAEIGL
jgi:hypothetical protein